MAIKILKNKFKDPNPSLTGPPSQNGSITSMGAPTVDNPNIKLQSQQVKGLDPGSAKSITSMKGSTKLPADTLSSKLPESPSLTSSDGVGSNWSPNKYSPASIAGNTKYVNPVTGKVGSTTESISNELENSKNSDNPRIKSANEKLKIAKSGKPTPKIIKPPSGPRVKIVKL